MIVHPTVTTPHPERWVALTEALGAAVTSADTAGATAGSPADALTSAKAQPPARAQTPAHSGLRIADFAGGRITIQPGETAGIILNLEADDAQRNRGSGDVAVAPVQYTPDVEGAAQSFADQGLRRRLTSDSGKWADLVGDGIVGVHDGKGSVVMSFETSDVTALQDPLARAGFRTTLIDESYGRTLRVEHPDDSSQDAEIWINETQTDTYGYTQHPQ